MQAQETDISNPNTSGWQFVSIRDPRIDLISQNAPDQYHEQNVRIGVSTTNLLLNNTLEPNRQVSIVLCFT
jgi:hypothetical protein